MDRDNFLKEGRQMKEVEMYDAETLRVIDSFKITDEEFENDFSWQLNEYIRDPGHDDSEDPNAPKYYAYRLKGDTTPAT